MITAAVLTVGFRRMGALKPWHVLFLMICMLGVGGIVAALVVVLTRRK